MLVHAQIIIFSYESMVKKIDGSTSSSSNVYEVIDDNSNCYRSIVMDSTRMNQGDVGECSIIDEESNANTTKLFNL